MSVDYNILRPSGLEGSMLIRWRIRRRYNEYKEERRLKRYIREQEKKYVPLMSTTSDDDLIDDTAFNDFIDATIDTEIELEQRKRRKLSRKAKKLGIEIPREKTEWYENKIRRDGEVITVLSELGEAQIRKLIRNHRRETTEWWVKVISGLTGLIGTIIGLIAILKK